MKKIIYYVATSIDGFICGKNEDISGFVTSGNGVEKYQSDLQEYKTVIMGRKTYEFGYQYGLTPGQPAYPHMKHYVFSRTLQFDDPHENVIVKDLDLVEIQKIKQESETDIYLCGGGELASWLWDNELIDLLKVKINPLVLGEGVRLFGDSIKGHSLRLTSTETYDQGLLINTYEIG